MYLTVSSIESSIEIIGFHPNDFAFDISRKVKGLSPIHPLESEPKMKLGFNPIVLETNLAESLTEMK